MVAIITALRLGSSLILGTALMPDYRAYIIGINGHFIRAEFFHSHPDDASAIKAAEQLVAGHDVELWELDRMVIRLKAVTK
jgi:hypothetical protein